MASIRKYLDTRSPRSGEAPENENIVTDLWSSTYILTSNADLSFRMSTIAKGVQERAGGTRVPEVEVAL